MKQKWVCLKTGKAPSKWALNGEDVNVCVSCLQINPDLGVKLCILAVVPVSSDGCFWSPHPTVPTVDDATIFKLLEWLTQAGFV